MTIKSVDVISYAEKKKNLENKTQNILGRKDFPITKNSIEKVMKICTITCHRVYNYGATLQAYSLQRYLKSLGHDVKIIDYIKEGTNQQFKYDYINPRSLFYSISKKCRIIKKIYLWIQSFRRNISDKRCALFDEFQNNNFEVTEIYSNIDELRKHPPLADVYIAGSDQIWNPNLSNGKDYSFYLDFGGKEIKRYSYAASFSISLEKIENSHLYFVKPLLNNFDSISVRESSGLDILSKLGLGGTEVLDPVFLLQKSEWMGLVNKNDYATPQNLTGFNNYLRMQI